MAALRYLIYFLILLAVVQCVDAGTFNNNLPGNTSGYYNLSIAIHEDPYIPVELWVYAASVGLILLVLSLFARPEQGNDILSILSIPPLAWASWGALQIAFIRSGAAGTNDPIVANVTNVYFLTRIDVYHVAGLALIFLACTIIAVINLYRILILNRTRDREVTPPAEDPREYDEGSV